MQASFDRLKRRLRTTGGALYGDGRGRTLVVVAAGWLAILGGRYLFPELLSAIRDTFHVSNATAGLAITVVWAAYAVMQFPAGMAADGFGERTLLWVSLVVAAVSITVVSFAPTFWVFVVGCAAFGLGTGLYGPARGMVLSTVFGDHDGAAIGLTLAAGSVGSAAIPFLASVFIGPLGWRVTVALLAAPYLVLAIGVWWAVPKRTPTEESTGSQSTGSQSAGLRSVQRVMRALETAVSRRAVIAVIAATLLLFVMQGLTAFLPTYLVTVKGFSSGRSAGLFAVFFLSGAVSQTIAGSAADRYGDRAVLLTTAGFGVLPLVALPFVDGFVPVSILTVLLGTRLAINPVSNAYIIGAIPESVRGTAWGFARTAFFLVAATGSTVVGVFFDNELADEALVVLAGLTLIAAACYVALPTRESA